jgi:hypothetical protein
MNDLPNYPKAGWQLRRTPGPSYTEVHARDVPVFHSYELIPPAAVVGMDMARKDKLSILELGRRLIGPEETCSLWGPMNNWPI